MQLTKLGRFELFRQESVGRRAFLVSLLSGASAFTDPARPAHTGNRTLFIVSWFHLSIQELESMGYGALGRRIKLWLLAVHDFLLTSRSFTVSQRRSEIQSPEDRFEFNEDVANDWNESLHQRHTKYDEQFGTDIVEWDILLRVRV